MRNELLEMKKEVEKLKADSEEKAQMVTVPYVAYEAEMIRLHKIIAKLIIVLGVFICGMLIYSGIPDDYSSQDIEDVDTITDSKVINNNGAK